MANDGDFDGRYANVEEAMLTVQRQTIETKVKRIDGRGGRGRRRVSRKSPCLMEEDP
jgi:hypothetical protein